MDHHLRNFNGVLSPTENKRLCNLSILPEFYGRTAGGLQLSTKAKVMSSIPLGHVFFATLIPSLLARSPYGGTLLSTHMTHATATHKQ
jgi:hypothetical protein